MIEDFATRLQPVPAHAVFSQPGYNVWCGSMTPGDDGRYHLFYSRWRTEHGFSAWVTHSEVAHAIADDPLGPYVHHGIALPERGADHWDGHCTHNPTVHCFGGRFYLYYTGNRGDRGDSNGLNFTHRNAQRIGVADADTPYGPWRRREQPLIRPSAGFHDALCCANPSVVARPGGDFLMIYKAVGDRLELPFGGPVVHVAATSASPDGPFTKCPDAVFTAAGAEFPAEDPFVWHAEDRYLALVKDMGGYFTGAGVSLALLTSTDGFAWARAEPALVARTEYRRADGRSVKLAALERPQIYFENGQPAILFCAAAEQETAAGRHDTYNVAIPLLRTEDRVKNSPRR